MSLFLPNELNIDSKRPNPALPPQLKKLFPGAVRLNVIGDGNCGYHVMQLIRYFSYGMIYETSVLKMMRDEILKKVSAKLVDVEDHYLEYLEVGLCLRDLALNVVMVVQNKKEYDLRVVNYCEKNVEWCFVLMSSQGRHYELLTKKNDAFFGIEESKRIFKRCGYEYPINTTKAENQIGILDPQDLLYF